MSFAAGAAPAAPATAAQAGGNPWRAMLDRAGWILGAGLAGGAIAWVFAVSQPHEYSASALVQVQQPRDNAATARTNALSMTATPMPFDVGLLRSRTVVAPVVERLHLDISARPLRAPLIGGLAAHFATPGQLSGPWPESLGYAWGGEQLSVERLA
ncbi:Wzz/FepE/Etk N-terminal domain-containing protein, partial [Cupriavidus sp. CER94]|uniref:Wzz/FepE/Etk N-terminal domain-containing protein n=1 Tax=Cupriavidus sp. CER94 TaxID=3377036 RepID=UPI003823461D